MCRCHLVSEDCARKPASLGLRLLRPMSLHDDLIARDRKTLWHPYSNSLPSNPLFAVQSAKGCTLNLHDGRQLIDGMASWWSVIHGYNHLALNHALVAQTEKMAHVMFGGLTHEPAVTLAEKLVALTPDSLERVFLADSGSVSVEVALKMAKQYWVAKGQPQKANMLAFHSGYHGDTWGAMGVCDPDNGMHQLFSGSQGSNIFAPAPPPLGSDSDAIDAQYTGALERLIQDNHQNLAAIIIEPVVQGAGGMRVYDPTYLTLLRSLCDQYDLLLIADEIATGFGRTGKWFACNHANISPDILCLGKALTGGYMTLAATLCTNTIAETISHSEAGVLMHGPTFMGNPLACAVANASLDLLMGNQWQQQVSEISNQLSTQLSPLKEHSSVRDVRVFGAIGVVELNKPVDMKRIQPLIVDQGVWLRPFGKLLYTMPPYVIKPNELAAITNCMKHVCDVVKK